MTLLLVIMMTHWICHPLDHISLRLLVSAALLYHPCTSSCYFPAELQGEFTMQSTAIGSHQVQYSHVSINADAIPIWGHCHRRIGLHHAILKDSSGVQDCIRCFFLNMRSRNILQVYTEGLAKCYTSEEAAEATCPQESQTERSHEILLYKTRDSNGYEIPLEYCPFGGRFTFTYDVDDGSENKVECPTAVSELHTCPRGSSLGLQFRRCSFDDHDITFQCLGDWQGPGKQRYLALLDTRQEQDDKPRYRCALYRINETSGNIELAFSSDSTCRSDLQSSVSGFETLTLKGVPLKRTKGDAWPTQRWPSTLLGKWQHLDITQDKIVFRDHETFKTFVFRSIATLHPGSGRFLVYGQTLCGEEFFTCLWIKERSYNVLEFQMGVVTRLSPNESLCSDSNFVPGKWNTQGRIEGMVESPCPIPGEYTGEIPDEKGLCARMWSHCNTSEMMHYTVADCYSQEVYEEREYRCLGQWEEEGRVYTYTRRNDVPSYECFVGKMVSDTSILVKEAGPWCQRQVDPTENGMEVTRRGPCHPPPPPPLPPTSRPHTPRQPPRTGAGHSQRTDQVMPEPTKPWKPITGRPHQVSSACRSVVPHQLYLLLLTFGLNHFLSPFRW